jgi:hypothetical protein
MESREKLETIHELFQHPGWPILYDILEGARANLGDIRAINSIEELHFNRGRLTQLDELRNFPELVREQLDSPEVDDAV